MIRSSTLSLKESNSQKLELVSLFIQEMNNAIQHYVDAYWDVTFKSNYCLDLKKLKKKMFMPTGINPPTNTKLSARSLKSAQKQAIGIINAATAKRYKQAYMLKKLQKNGNNTKYLQRKLSNSPLVKPSLPKEFGVEINSITCSIEKSDTSSFDYWLHLKSLFNKEFKKELGTNEIYLPLKSHRHFNQLLSKGKLKASVLLSKKSVSIRVEIDNAQQIANNTGSEIIAIDQGATTLLSVASSSGDTFVSTKCPHGHDMASIMQKLSRTKKGSKGFKRAQEHRKNYINWSINQLNWNNIKELRLEEIHDMGRGQKKSRYLSHFSFSLIESKLQAKCEEKGVLFSLQSNEYRSQRCSDCGFVHKTNRKNKSFVCKACGVVHDSDINAAQNHLVDLPELDRYAICGLNKTTGFYWNPEFEGVYSPFPKQ